jgi:two-component system, NtrC family, sensor kinase
MMLRTPAWLAHSVRNKLLTMALLPLLVALPLLVLALAIWSNLAYDRLLITKVRSDLAVARGYFDQVLTKVGAGTEGVAGSQRLLAILPGLAPQALQQQLARDRERLGLDLLLLHSQQGQLLGSADTDSQGPWMAAGEEGGGDSEGGSATQLMLLDRDSVARVAPHLLPRLGIALVPTRNAAPDDRASEDRAMLAVSSAPVRDAQGRVVAVLTGGILLNQNLPFIDHINRIVYPEGSLPFGSQGTATLFLDDVRITTNAAPAVRGPPRDRHRVSNTVRQAVLGKAGPGWTGRSWSTTGTSRPTSR